MNNIKKVVLVLMEGINDERTTYPHIESLIENSDDSLKAKQKAIFYDITNQTDTGKFIDSTNIKSFLNAKIKEALNEYHLTRSDLSEIILILDIDGIYLDDDLIEENIELENVNYSEKGIVCKNKDSLLSRNERKRNNIEYLLKYVTYLTKTPLRLFYYSCNSEHVLYNEMNCSRERKRQLAIDAIKISDKDYWDIIFKNSINKSNSYFDSWSSLACITQSIPKLTNLNVLYNDYSNKSSKINNEIDNDERSTKND